jgi:Lon-like ATP-dependent protease
MSGNSETVEKDDTKSVDEDVGEDVGEDIDGSPDETSDEERRDLQSSFSGNEHLINDEEEDNLLGGLDIDTTADVNIPDKLIDQVIGQERARTIIKKAARQHRHLMMIGSPGTGKSMLAQSMTEIMPKENLVDALVYPNPKDQNNPRVRTVPAGKGQQIIDAHRQKARKKDKARSIITWVIIGFILLYTFLFAGGQVLLGIIAAVAVYFVSRYIRGNGEQEVPNLLINNEDSQEAPFEDATGAHSGALLGDVRHDPFQSGGMETPSHNRVEAGAIHKSDNGVLFIDEINTLGVESQQKLMTAIQEGEFSITGQSERSSGAMVQTEAVPTNFIMVAAGNMDAIENMHPALRNRIQGYGYEVYMDDTIDDNPENRRKFVRFVAQEVIRDGSIPHFTDDAVSEIILQAQRSAGQEGKLTLQLRGLGGLVRNAGDIARDDRDSQVVKRKHVLEAKGISQSVEQQYVDNRVEQKQRYDNSAKEPAEVGRVNGLAVMGEDSGIVLPVMSKVAQSQKEGKGEVIATGKLKDIAREAVTNVSAVIKDVSDADLTEKDIHVQFVQTYEGVQGDSASVTVATAIVSALEGIPVKQNIAMTGSLSVRGDVLPVGGVTHKIEAAAKMGVDTVIIPKANKKDVMIEDEYRDKVDVIPVEHINEVLDIALAENDNNDRAKLLERLTELANAPSLPTDPTDITTTTESIDH